MNYLMFNNSILLFDGETVQTIEKSSSPERLKLTLDKANVCVVDVDVLIAAAVELPIEKKDSILVRKFNELYHHETYIIQDERIDNNLFQVIGIKEQKVREVYSLIPSDMVESFVPYGIALRNTLINRRIDLNKTVVFVDDLGSERLLTVFDGFKFSRTRVIANNGEDILPEIKRSQIDYFKKSEEFLSKKSSDFVIVVNNEALAATISRNTEKLHVQYLNVRYPALEGLKDIDSSIKYRLPEETIKKRKEIELRKKIRDSVITFSIFAIGLIFFLFNSIESGIVSQRYELAKQAHQQFDAKLNLLDKETYRESLRMQKNLNYGITYLSMLEIIPASYMVNSFRFYKLDSWNLEMTLFADDNGIFDAIPRIKILKNAEIKDIFSNNQPGKHLRITL